MNLLPSSTGAIISPCGQYRYRLWREWDNLGPKCTFVMLNPSTADAEHDDPTIRRCVGFARALACGRLEVANLYPLRATDSSVLITHPDPVGPAKRADEAILEAVSDASWIVCAWGAHPIARSRAASVLQLIRHSGRSDYLFHLGLNRDRSPKHPLYVASSTKPRRFAT